MLRLPSGNAHLVNDVKHALLLIPRVKKENHLGGCRRSHRGGGVLECFFVLCTLISCPSSRLIGSIVTEISDTEQKLLFMQQFVIVTHSL